MMYRITGGNPLNTNALHSARFRLTAAAVLAAGVLGAIAACSGTAVAAATPGTGHSAASGSSASSAAASATAAPSHANVVSTQTTGTAPATSAASAAQSGVPAPGTYVPAAWLTPGHMPLAQPGVTVWDPAGGVGMKLGGDVYAASLPQVMACNNLGTGAALAAGLGHDLAGTQYDTYQASNSDKILPNGAIPAYAAQYALFYANSAQASAAMKNLSADYASCAREVTGIDPTTGGRLVGSDDSTLNQVSAQCWSLLAAGVSGGAGNGTIDHTCFVQSGSVIGAATVSVNEVGTLSTMNFGAVDPTTVSGLRQSLGAYTSGN
jgi:hypothetical protein